jgi:hypothetical protein
MTKDEEFTRQERREMRLERKRERMRKHGRNLSRMYKEAIQKRIIKLRKDKEKGPER